MRQCDSFGSCCLFVRFQSKQPANPGVLLQCIDVLRECHEDAPETAVSDALYQQTDEVFESLPHAQAAFLRFASSR
jgi:hypothetical protein